MMCLLRHMIAAATLALLAAGCASIPEQAPTARRVWPAPPAPARIAFEREIHSALDLGIQPSTWRRFANFVTGSDQGREPFLRPQGVAVDEAGNLCVADTGAGAAYYFDLANRRSYRWTQVGADRLIAPVAMGHRRGMNYVADTGLGKVLAFDGRGQLVFAITNGLERPAGLALTSNELVITDAQLHRVVVFDLQGRLLRQFGQRGTAPGEFNAPTHVTIDPRGQLVVTDSLNFRVQVLDAQGHPLAVLGSVGDRAGHFSRPKGVALDRHRHLYVVDALFDNVQIFDEQGRVLMHWGESGNGPGEFWLPGGMAIDGNDRIFVADAYNQRIQVFRFVGQE